jgi:solute carrier family 10 (sodium/bile acid cotransporter), member 7
VIWCFCIQKLPSCVGKFLTELFHLLQIILLGIVYNAFCNAFSSGLGIEFSHSLALMSILPAMHLLSLGGLFKFFSLKLFKLSRPEIVSAMFCASQKTLAFGLPLVNTIFEGNSNLAAYCAPIMFIHPLQMIIGSLLLPNVNMYTEAYKDRMGEGK